MKRSIKHEICKLVRGMDCFDDDSLAELVFSVSLHEGDAVALDIEEIVDFVEGTLRVPCYITEIPNFYMVGGYND